MITMSIMIIIVMIVMMMTLIDIYHDELEDTYKDSVDESRILSLFHDQLPTKTTQLSHTHHRLVQTSD